MSLFLTDFFHHVHIHMSYFPRREFSRNIWHWQLQLSGFAAWRNAVVWRIQRGSTERSECSSYRPLLFHTEYASDGNKGLSSRNSVTVCCHREAPHWAFWWRGYCTDRQRVTDSAFPLTSLLASGNSWAAGSRLYNFHTSFTSHLNSRECLCAYIMWKILHTCMWLTLLPKRTLFRLHCYKFTISFYAS